MSSAEGDQDGRALALRAEAERAGFVQPGEEDNFGAPDGSLVVPMGRSLRLCTLVHGVKMTDNGMN